MRLTFLDVAKLLVCLVTMVPAVPALGVSGAAFTTFNAHVDGAGKDVCKNSAIDCNIYGAKEYVWLNGGPTANGLGPDGQYFFAVLVPGGQPNPNDGGAKNLSDDYDAYTNRTFTITNGEVSYYGGTHWLDNGKSGPKPNGELPYIRLFPYADTTNPGGVYILAICSLTQGYPVDPRYCKYDAFKVKKGKVPYQFMLSGIKFEDTYADGVKDASTTDPGLAGWTIGITGTGPDGQPISATAVTGAGGYWEYQSPEYTFAAGTSPQAVVLKVCEVLQAGWTQSYPNTTDGCHSVGFTPVVPSFDSFEDLDFGNWRPVDVKACKEWNLGGSKVPGPGWTVSLTRENVVIDTQVTGADGCYTWTGLTPGFSYDVHEAEVPGWVAEGPYDYAFPKAGSGGCYSHTFVNDPLQGCTPGFWQGGNELGTAGGKWLWNEYPDPQWVASGGSSYNPYIWTTQFCSFFACSHAGTMWYFVNPELWTVNDDFHKAARSLVAAYLNASWDMSYAYSTAQLVQMWNAALDSGQLLSLHLLLDAANNAYYRNEYQGGPHCPISAGSW